MTRSRIEFTADVRSIDTGSRWRDGNLMRAAVLDAERHPFLDYRSTSVTRVYESYAIVGQLTLRGVTKEVPLGAVLGAPKRSLVEGVTRPASIFGTIKRTDFLVYGGSPLARLAMSVDINLELRVLLRLSPLSQGQYVPSL